MRVVLIHDCIVHIGGAERVLQSLHAAYPEAPVYTLFCDRKAVREMLPGADIRTSFAQRLPGINRWFRAYAPLLPAAVESFDLSGFDVILSSSFAFAKGVIPPLSACHICYCHTPLRYLWSEYHSLRSTILRQWWKRVLADLVINHLKRWDLASVGRVDYFIANSQTTAARIAKYYRRDSTIIHPPARVKAISPSHISGDYYLLVSRLMPYKRVDLAIQAFNQLGLPLKIVGTGPELAQLRRLAKPNVELLGPVSDTALADLYKRCRAFVFPAIEDFGIVMVEAQAYGKPVIACAGGGALEIVIDGETGVLFDGQTPEALVAAIMKFQDLKFEIDRIRAHALQFDESEFQERIRQFVAAKLSETRRPRPDPSKTAVAAFE